VERCKKCIACQGRYFEKETVTAPPQNFDSEQCGESTNFSNCPRIKGLIRLRFCIHESITLVLLC